mmetsp:Transcript_7874/g.12797  ORF Transcript_7874/g.12797 Transcript_7874/m.12797 type:complete len:152 (+) Transcript_7874:18-473(+)
MYALDNRVICPTSQQNRERHLCKVKLLCEKMADDKATKVEEWENLAPFWAKRTCMGNLPKEAIKEMMIGFKNASDRAVAELSKKRLRAMVEKLRGLNEDAGSKFWDDQINGINVDYIGSIVDILRRHLSEDGQQNGGRESKVRGEEEKLSG